MLCPPHLFHRRQIGFQIPEASNVAITVFLNYTRIQEPLLNKTNNTYPLYKNWLTDGEGDGEYIKSKLNIFKTNKMPYE